jgi:hypothetical protein
LKAFALDEHTKTVEVIAAHIEERHTAYKWLFHRGATGPFLDDNITPLAVYLSVVFDVLAASALTHSLSPIFCVTTTVSLSYCEVKVLYFVAVPSSPALYPFVAGTGV